ncbi:integrin beta-nu isoform X1 [Maniola jurtina]|uniref:integrin beta-nu isoform X1 n=1 Tax=Maniola jurtina TaxID=191418 RepID=UPI001E685F30|nr:integrin beta-nu isoform X1 [Maniola jurtina]
MFWRFFVITLFNLCIISIVGYVDGQVQQQLLNKLACIEHEECGACLSAASHCRWCADPYYSSSVPRCNDDETLVADGCAQNMIQRPYKPIWDVAENHTLQDMAPDSHEAVVQIQPQKITFSLKPRESKKIKFSYRPAKNYPLDLYYLMDLTWSMKDDKETLVSLRDDLPSLLKNLTDNFRLGFGSFADKPIMPFTSVDPRRLANPCAVEEEACEATYSYKHHLSLTNQVNEFIKKVNSSSVTANLDNAEAQLDALVQAITCDKEVGWSPHSRKIIILLSDGLLHTAGDGKLGGASMKNDENCHLDKNGYYSEAGIYDYPSIAQVYRLLDKYKVNVIFAVTENVKSHYDSLHELLIDFTYVAKLESDSSNILKLVKMGYEDIVSVVNFEDDATAGPIKVKYFTDCGVKGGSMVEATRCTGVEYGMTLNYEAHVSLESCPEYKKSHHTITISESQLGQDSLTLEVEVHCGCECEGNVQQGMVLCPANSHLVCGVCQCNKGWSGPYCNCSIEDEAASAALSAQCREPNVTRAIPCSGSGECICGKCECDPGSNGRYCQCKSCQKSRINNVECGGIERGVCVCGECACVRGWSGDSCDCTDSTDTCVAPASEEVCSGHGECVCGRCQCYKANQAGTAYSGAFCETCATCENPLCANAEPCILCHLNSSCTDVCTIGNVNYTVTKNMNEAAPNNDDISCILRQEEDGLNCEYRYTYRAGIKSMIAMEMVITAKQCTQPTSAQIMTTALITMACVIAAGLIVILGVKSAQVVSDRRAYAKFVQEAQESRKHMQELNPLYKSPISEFRLPESYPRDRHDM